MLTIIVVRHGEVFNPNHVVYADLPGFDLSATGVVQAQSLGNHLAAVPVDVVLSSPLARARHTAAAISRHHDGVGVTVDPRLTETRMYPAWTGMTWDDVERRYPHQLQGYLRDATALRDVSESVGDVLERVTASVVDAIGHGHETIVVVGHQDPSQALRLSLLGRPLSALRHDPPGHASATTITRDDGGAFVEVSTWNPEIIDLRRQSHEQAVHSRYRFKEHRG
ncbi:MAG: histidine phosphatase family protein [Actinomycetota bacterium]